MSEQVTAVKSPRSQTLATAQELRSISPSASSSNIAAVEAGNLAEDSKLLPRSIKHNFDEISNKMDANPSKKAKPANGPSNAASGLPKECTPLSALKKCELNHAQQEDDGSSASESEIESETELAQDRESRNRLAGNLAETAPPNRDGGASMSFEDKRAPEVDPESSYGAPLVDPTVAASDSCSAKNGGRKSHRHSPL
eukprot:ANDGO_07237.mRNA.1 hypothetical protein